MAVGTANDESRMAQVENPRPTPLGAKTKPIEANRLKQLAISNLSQNQEERSHGGELVVKSIGYGHSRAVFRKVTTDMGRSILPIWEDAAGKRVNHG